MEYNWERSLPFFNIDVDIANKLLDEILEGNTIENIIPINEGCRTSNYILKITNLNKKYILKIFPELNWDYEKENNLLKLLKDKVPVQNIYCILKSSIINNRRFGLYEYIEGQTLGQAIKNGYVIDEEFIKEVAKALATIHKFKFNSIGKFNDKLEVVENLPSLYTWYDNFMDINFKNRLGQDVVDRIKNIVKNNFQVLIDLDKDISLVHGDFQGTNILINNNKLAGIIDWEFSMAGHALADIGQLFRYENYFNEKLVNIFEKEYNKYSDKKLIKDWYKIAKLRDLVNLIQLISANEEMPNKYKEIKGIIMKTLDIFE
ncbi:phosphotransferase family protein [Clostridium weizhouense]|uniref:Aminoglycoside phosphotransferase family protein n=1 Tax=Clostridium weizhouense TaxID=2859781 RepID=A0ABS7AS32_9CLOT|nr:aminoglycoside phosphotransferase family protein [Clostridium weizhouense]MBW6411497.1 aminoglycoside phosphotransferase family protein [Clostridium weizhouense]